MFSVYGKAGRIFRGAMEELRHVSAVNAAARSHAVMAVGLDPQDQNPARLGELLAPQSTGVDVAHRTALAAYEQARKPDHPRQPITQVLAVMTHAVVTLPENLRVEEAWQELLRNHVGQAPVVSAQGVLMGLLTRADLMRPELLPGPEQHALAWRALMLQSVADVMWTPVPSVEPQADIRHVARVMLDTGLPGLPVVDDQGGVSGFISRTDILRAVVADPPLDMWT